MKKSVQNLFNNIKENRNRISIDEYITINRCIRCDNQQKNSNIKTECNFYEGKRRGKKEFNFRDLIKNSHIKDRIKYELLYKKQKKRCISVNVLHELRPLTSKI